MISMVTTNKGLCAKSSMVHNLNLMKYLGYKVNGGYNGYKLTINYNFWDEYNGGFTAKMVVDIKWNMFIARRKKPCTGMVFASFGIMMSSSNWVISQSTLWWTNIAMERSTIFNGKIHYKWPFSIAVSSPEGILRMHEFFFWLIPMNSSAASLQKRGLVLARLLG